MEAVVERGNLKLAYQRVVENKGAAGVDDITVSELKDHLKQHWPGIRAKLLAGAYVPQPVRRVDIPKPDGGVRTLSIPTVVDRLIQQSLHQVFKRAETKQALDTLDGWIRRKLRCVLWRQAKRVHTRARMLMKRGLTEERAWRSATNQRGPWFNAGAGHMHIAFPKSWFDSLGLVSLPDTVQRLQRVS